MQPVALAWAALLALVGVVASVAALPSGGGVVMEQPQQQQQQQWQPPPPMVMFAPGQPPLLASERLRREAQSLPAAAVNVATPPSNADKLKEPPKKKPRKSFEQECLAAHNKWRRLHHAPPLEFDKKIAVFSQKRADFIAASDGDEFKHPPDLPYGENLAWHSRATKSCADLVKMWYDEVELYDFSRGTFSLETGHFTQLVWRQTRRVGCASAISSGPKGGIYLVCNYDPAGNYLGEAIENVLRRTPPVPSKPAVPTVTTNNDLDLDFITSTMPSFMTTSTGRSVGGARGTSTSATTATTLAATTAAPVVNYETSTSAGNTTKKPAANEQKKKNKKKNKNKRKKKGNKKNKKKNKRPTESPNGNSTITTTMATAINTQTPTTTTTTLPSTLKPSATG